MLYLSVGYYFKQWPQNSIFLKLLCVLTKCFAIFVTARSALPKATATGESFNARVDGF
jgi:hypothetical protein